MAFAILPTQVRKHLQNRKTAVCWGPGTQLRGQLSFMQTLWAYLVIKILIERLQHLRKLPQFPQSRQKLSF